MEASTLIRTMCPMNCHPTLCGMLAELREGKLVGVRGDKANPDSEGFLCVRGKASAEVIGNPRRLMRPLIRERHGQEKHPDDAWREVDWEEALDLIAEGMRAAGNEAAGFWFGHGAFTNNYGTRLNLQLVERFSNLYGCQSWNPAMICWGLGGFGLGLTGVLEVNTKEDMGRHARLILLWGANLASQPNTSRYLLAAKRRGAEVVTIDVRKTEAAAQSDDTFLIRPGGDAALALAMMHVIIAEGLHDAEFVARHTLGFEELRAHVRAFTPAWGEERTGIPAERIVGLARTYAAVRPAMIVLGGASMHKGANGWWAARAVGCLPALTGNLGIPGGGFGPRHGGPSHGAGMADLTAPEKRPPGRRIPNQMSRITEALLDGGVKVLFMLGTNMLSSFADSEQVAKGLERAELVVGYDLFMNETTRRFADVVLPSTSWLEELGCKATNTHLYLMERALPAPGETRPLHWILNELAGRLGLENFYPWDSEEAVIDAILDHPYTGHATVESLRAQNGIRDLNVSHVAYPTLEFTTPSGKVEFFSARARELGLPALPPYQPPHEPAHERPHQASPAASHERASASAYPLALCHGRTLSHFHAFYDHGRALPTLARQDPGPRLWISPADARARKLADGADIRIHNERGEFAAKAQVTDNIPEGVVWIRDGWEGSNRLTEGCPVLPDAAVNLFHFSAGQASYDTRVEVSAE